METLKIYLITFLVMPLIQYYAFITSCVDRMYMDGTGFPFKDRPWYTLDHYNCSPIRF